MRGVQDPHNSEFWGALGGEVEVTSAGEADDKAEAAAGKQQVSGPMDGGKAGVREEGRCGVCLRELVYDGLGVVAAVAVQGQRRQRVSGGHQSRPARR